MSITISTSIASSGTGGVTVQGCSDNSSATAGSQGETIRASATGVSLPASGSVNNVTSISLTAGDWLINSTVVASSTGTTFTSYRSGIGATSGSFIGTTSGDSQLSWNAEGATGLVGGKALSLTNPGFRVSLSATTTYFLVQDSIYTGTIPTTSGRISAVRIR